LRGIIWLNRKKSSKTPKNRRNHLKIPKNRRNRPKII